jgi:hypothetical protein
MRLSENGGNSRNQTRRDNFPQAIPSAMSNSSTLQISTVSSLTPSLWEMTQSSVWPASQSADPIGPAFAHPAAFALPLAMTAGKIDRLLSGAVPKPHGRRDGSLGRLRFASAYVFGSEAAVYGFSSKPSDREESRFRPTVRPSAIRRPTCLINAWYRSCASALAATCCVSGNGGVIMNS